MNNISITTHCVSISTHLKTLVFLLISISLPQIVLNISNVIASEKTAIIIQSQQISAYNDAVKGFEEECKRKNITILKIYDLKGEINIEEGKRLIQDIKTHKNKPMLIFAVGVLAATLTKGQINDIPIIFCMVINHERLNLRGPNITGISAQVSIEEQFAFIKDLLNTRKPKNIGVIYDPKNTENIISEAASVAKKYNFNLIKSEVASERHVVSALKNIINKIDALWIIPDETVITKDSLNTIIKETQKHRLPAFCTSSAIVKMGALISISPDYTNTGFQAAQIAQTLLNNPTITSLGIQQPEKLKLTVNTQTAEMIGINLLPLKSRTDIVFYP